MRLLVLTLALFSLTAQAEGLEVSLVVSTADGIQFEPIHGCYEYGLFVKAATAEKNFGRSIASHLEGLSEVEVYRVSTSCSSRKASGLAPLEASSNTRAARSSP